jgi:hypothetical protein
MAAAAAAAAAVVTCRTIFNELVNLGLSATLTGLSLAACCSSCPK